MAEYIDRTELEPDTEWSEYYDDFISYSQSQINSLPTADVVERCKIDKAIEEIEEHIKNSKLPTVNRYNTYSEGLKDCLDILKRNIGE